MSLDDFLLLWVAIWVAIVGTLEVSMLVVFREVVAEYARSSFGFIRRKKVAPAKPTYGVPKP